MSSISAVLEEARDDSPGVIAAIDRALAVLLAIGEAGAPVTLARLADHMDLHKSTLLRTLGTLERRRFLMRRHDGRWQLGPALLHLGAVCRAGLELRAVVEPRLLALAERTGESATFFVREGDQRLCLLRVESQQDVRDHMPEGTLLPFDRGAAGRILTRFVEADPAAGPLVVVSLGETNPELAAIAAPVFGESGRLIGALSCGGTKSRFAQSAHQQLVWDAVQCEARVLTEALGGDAQRFDQAG